MPTLPGVGAEDGVSGGCSQTGRSWVQRKWPRTETINGSHVLSTTPGQGAESKFSNVALVFDWVLQKYRLVWNVSCSDVLRAQGGVERKKQAGAGEEQNQDHSSAGAGFWSMSCHKLPHPKAKAWLFIFHFTSLATLWVDGTVQAA